MAVQEAGTRILHEHGILDSKVPSPHRTQTLEDGNLQQQTSKEVKKSKDESTQRLIDDGNPIAPDNVPPRQSDTFFKELMVYIFGLIAIIAVWLIIADISHVSNQLKINDIYQLSWIPASLGVGIFIGSYLIIPLLLKVYALFIIQFFASFAVGVAVLQYNYLNFSSLLFAMVFLGIGFGVIERFSYLYIHQVLQSSKRKVLFFYAVLAFGLVFANLIVLNSTVLPMKNIANSDSHIRVKHDVGLHALNLSVYNPENQMTTQAYRPTKPSSAIGISENQDTKTAENAEKRKLAEQKKENMVAALNATADCLVNPNAENCTTTLTSTSTIESTTTSTSTSTPTTTFYTSTSTIVLKKDSIFDGTPLEPMVSSNPVDPIPRNRNRQNKIPAQNENSKQQKPNFTAPASKESTTPTFVASIIFIFFLFPFNFSAFICNHFWSKETVLNLSIASETFKQPSFVTRITSIILWFLSDFLTSGLFSLSPFIYASLFDKKIDEFSFYYGILIWGLVFFKRILLYIFSDFAVSKRCMQILIFSSLCCSIIFFVLTKSDLSFIIFLGIGITVSSLPILIALHQQATMNLSPYITSWRYMLWSSMGRIFGPLIMGKILANNSVHILTNLVFLIIIIMLVAFYYFTKNVTSTARHQQLQDLTMDISSPQNNVTNSPINNGAASSSSISSTIKTRSTQYGTKYSLIDAGDTDSLSNCLISDSEEDELLSYRH